MSSQWGRRERYRALTLTLCFAAVCIFIFGAPPPLHLQAQFPLHEPLVDANGSKTQSQRSRPVAFAPPVEGASSSSRPLLLATRRQLQLVSAMKEPVPGASGAEAAVDKARGPVGPSLADLAIGSPVPFPAEATPGQ